MKTFVAWLIANMELLFAAIMIVASLLFISKSEVGWEVAGGVAFLIYILFSVITSGRSFVGSLLIAVLSSVLHLYLYGVDRAGFWLVLVPSVAVPLAVAVFTAANMHEVTSRRMLYVNSNTDLFELTLLYTLNRFFTAYSWITVVLFFLLRLDALVAGLAAL